MFLGDFVDRNPGVKETIDYVLELLRRPAGGAAVKGNHDLALIRAARLDGGLPSPIWLDHYRTRYDHQETFESYLGRTAMTWAMPGARTWRPSWKPSPRNTGTS